MHHDDHKCANQIEDDHKRNQLLCKSRYSLKSAHDDQGATARKIENAYGQIRNMKSTG